MFPGPHGGPLQCGGDGITSAMPSESVRSKPKGHNTGKWRLITDLSFPPGESVNDGIDATLCSLSYTTVDQVVANYGSGALLAKIDIEAAYRLVPVHPQDHPLQAVRWKENTYIDLMLPFGLR